MNAVNTYLSRRGVAPVILSHGNRRSWMVIFAVLPQKNNPLCPENRILDGDHSRCGCFGEEKNLLILSGVEGRCLGYPARFSVYMRPCRSDNYEGELTVDKWKTSLFKSIVYEVRTRRKLFGIATTLLAWRSGARIPVKLGNLYFLGGTFGPSLRPIQTSINEYFVSFSAVQRPGLHLVPRLRMCGAILASPPLICFHGIDRFYVEVKGVSRSGQIVFLVNNFKRSEKLIFECA